MRWVIGDRSVSLIYLSLGGKDLRHGVGGLEW